MESVYNNANERATPNWLGTKLGSDLCAAMLRTRSIRSERFSYITIRNPSLGAHHLSPSQYTMSKNLVSLPSVPLYLQTTTHPFFLHQWAKTLAVLKACLSGPFEIMRRVGSLQAFRHVCAYSFNLVSRHKSCPVSVPSNFARFHGEF